MLKINQSPIFWLVLGTSWSAAVFFSYMENGFVFNLSLVPIGLLALSSYALAVFFAFKRNSLKKDSRNH